MKNSLFFFLLFLSLPVVFQSCTKTNAKDTRISKERSYADVLETGFDSVGKFVATSAFVSVEEANRMIGSYLRSIGYPSDNSSIRAWTINGDALRKVLTDNNIKSVKFMLGHNMDYILSGQEGRVPDSSSKALTLLAIGLDSAGNYITTDGEVLDKSMPCPELCPPGTGSSGTITTNP